MADEGLNRVGCRLVLKHTAEGAGVEVRLTADDPQGSVRADPVADPRCRILDREHVVDRAQILEQAVAT